MKRKVISILLSAFMMIGTFVIPSFAESAQSASVESGYLVNVALNKPVTVNLSEYTGTMLTDGFVDNYLEPNAAFDAVIDLEESVAVDEIRLFSADGNLDVNNYVSIYLSSDGEDYRQVDWTTGTVNKGRYLMFGEYPHGSINFSLAEDSAEYRYVKIVADSAWRRVCEVEVLSRKSTEEVVPADKNVALNKNAKRIVGSTGTDQSAKLTDGSDAIGEFWQGDVVIDLGGYYPVDKIAAHSRVDEYYSAINYTLTLSDISTFTGDNTVVVKSSDQSCVKGLSVYDNPSKNELFRYVKFSLTDAYAVMNEIMVFTEFGKNEIPVDRNIAQGIETYTSGLANVANLFDGNDLALSDFNAGSVLVDLCGYYKLDSIAIASRLDGYHSGNASTYAANLTIKASNIMSAADGAVGTEVFKSMSDPYNLGITIYDNPSPDKYYRYVKLDISGYICLNELKIFAASDSVYNADGNVALGKPVFVTGGFAKTQSAYLTDGSAALVEYFNYGYPDGLSGSFAQIDLGAEYDLGKIVVGLRDSGDSRNNWIIQISSDKKFTSPKTFPLTSKVADGCDWVADIDEPVSCRYIRLSKSVDEYDVVTEVAAYTKTNSKTGCVDGLIVNGDSIDGVNINPGYNLKNTQLIVVSYDDYGIIDCINVKLDNALNTTYQNDNQRVMFNRALNCGVDSNGNTKNRIAVYTWSDFEYISPVTNVFNMPVGTHIVD